MCLNIKLMQENIVANFCLLHEIFKPRKLELCGDGGKHDTQRLIHNASLIHYIYNFYLLKFWPYIAIYKYTINQLDTKHTYLPTGPSMLEMLNTYTIIMINYKEFKQWQ